MVGPSETVKSQLTYKWLEIGTFQSKFDKIYFYYHHSQPLYNVMQNEIKNLEFVKEVNFDFIDSVKNNGIKYKVLVNI